MNGNIAPLYFGRDGKEQFHETIMREEDAFLKRTEGTTSQTPSTPPVPKSKDTPPQREAYVGIP